VPPLPRLFRCYESAAETAKVVTAPAVIFGAGNVGRGFLGQLFSESGREVVFVEVDRTLVSALNTRRTYTIRLVDNERADEVTISPVRALHAQEVDAVAETLSLADVGATAVGVRALPRIAPLVAAGIMRRNEIGAQSPLNIIICENLKNAAEAFRTMVGEHLSDEHQDYLRTHIGFVDTVIGRMIPPLSAHMRKRDPSLIAVEPYKELPVDRQGFVGTVPRIVGMEPYSPFAAYTARKLYIHNCGHALLGYLGRLRGHALGYEALQDEAVRLLLERALAEARAGIVAEYGVTKEWLEDHIDDLLRRFGNRALADTTLRLGRDPMRKLGPEDRLVGAARLAEKARRAPEALSWGIAAGYLFDDVDDPLAVELQKRVGREGLGTVLADVSRIDSDEPLGVLVHQRYRALREGTWSLPQCD